MTTTTAKNVLDPGTVESRGFGGDGNPSRDEVADQIETFLSENTWSVRSELRCFLNIFVFVTALPCPSHWAALHPGLLMKGMCYFPLVGAIVGILVAQIFDLGLLLWELPIVAAAALSTAVSLKITGCLHEDGLADTADGIGGGWTRQQILRIMSDSRLGTFGSAALMLYIFAKLQLLAALGASKWEFYDMASCGNEPSTSEELLPYCGSQGAGPALVVAHTLARWTAPYLIWRCDYIEEDGPKSTFYSFMIRAKFLVSIPRILASLLFSFGVTASLFGPLMATKLIASVWVFAEFAGSYGRTKLGGVMGDFLGGTICLTEIFIYAGLAGGSVLDSIKSLAEVLMDPSNSSSEKLNSILQDEKLRLVAHFALMSILYQLWCWMVRASEKRFSDKALEREKSGHDVKKPSNDKPKSSSPQKEEAQNVLNSSTSSFLDKYNAVQAYLDVLAKPVGSLGTLEEWAARISVLQNSLQPKANHVSAIIFAGDHGVAAAKEEGGEGCSLYPQAITRAILEGLQKDIAGASVLAQGQGLNLSVIDVGVLGDAYTGKVVNSAKSKLAKGTRNFCMEPAMTMEEVDRCINMGKEAIAEAAEKSNCQVVALGEVGIGNTTTASTLIAALTGKPVADLCGGGAFASHTADDDKIKRKIEIVEMALEKHKGSLKEAISILSKVGGSEIAALVGAMIEASDRKIAVLVDGFIVTAAALVAVRMKPSVCNALFLTTKSAEKGQVAAIEQIQDIAREHNLPVPASPALDMGLRMGEGTGALLAVPILQSSTTMITHMATIQDIL